MDEESALSSRNRTINLTDIEIENYRARLATLDSPASLAQIIGKTIHQDTFTAAKHLPKASIDLLILDPPYNLNKEFNMNLFRAMSDDDYGIWMENWLVELLPALKDTASVYVCCDWHNSSAVYQVIKKYFKVRNRITWEREKGRGAKHNWKNCSEDIWFATVSNKYYFDADSVKLKRKVIAPYRDKNGDPKDWMMEEDAGFRMTSPSNLWTDITVPFWSMPENTVHPTQKPEKLLAKLILASSAPGDLVFDPFLGSGSTSVVAKKLGRNYCGIEVDTFFACLAEKRLESAVYEAPIQGYEDGVFWERNTQYRKQNGRR